MTEAIVSGSPPPVAYR